MVTIILAVDADGQECFFKQFPIRENDHWCAVSTDIKICFNQKGIIENMLGYKLTFEDNPVTLITI